MHDCIWPEEEKIWSITPTQLYTPDSLFCAFVHVWPYHISFPSMDNSCSAFKSQAKWQLFQEAFHGWPQCEICTPCMFFHNTPCVSVTALIKCCFVNIFMCLTFLWECQLPESRDSLWLTLVCPLFISQFWHIALHTCFMNQCFKGWHTEEDSFYVVPVGLKTKRHLA